MKMLSEEALPLLCAPQQLSDGSCPLEKPAFSKPVCMTFTFILGGKVSKILLARLSFLNSAKGVGIS